jgi:hypothetical protein
MNPLRQGLNPAMSNLLYKALFLVSLLLPVSVVAEDDHVKAGVSIGFEQGQEIWMGQQITLNLDLKTTGLSFSNTLFNLPEVNGAFLMQTDTTTIKFSETIDGQDWQIIRYPLALYPQKAGQLEVPPINVRFSSSVGFGSTENDFEFQTEPLALTVRQPPGVKTGDLVITTTSLELDHDWQPKSENLHAGDAITLTVTRRANDISAMLLPPLPVFRHAGLAAYPQAPEVSDKTNRGDLTGERVDTIIWVVEKPGIYEIPGIRFQWWDPVGRELKQQIVPGLSLDIPSSPSDGSVADATTSLGKARHSLLPILLILLAGLLTIALWWRFGRKTGDQHLDDEKSAFTALQNACKSNQATQTHAAIHTWLGYSSSSLKFRHTTLNEFARNVNDQSLATELENLQEAIVASNEKWQGNELLVSLQAIRHKINAQKKVQLKTYLAPLNP